MVLDILSKILPSYILDKLIILNNRTRVLFANLRYGLLRTNKCFNYYNIPIVINNYNRLNFLCKLISSLESRGYYNIYIIDNASTYPPLLEYYKKCPYTIYRLNRNVGYKSIWETGIYQQFKNDYYVYTDSDMQIDESCPNDFMEYFVKILRKYPTCQKVGFGIRIDDLPDTYCNKAKVIEWERQFWENEVEPGLYRASIDTTFALYRPYCKGTANGYQKVFRTGAPYLIKHLPWYDLQDSKEEEEYYLSSISTNTHWSWQNS